MIDIEVTNKGLYPVKRANKIFPRGKTKKVTIRESKLPEIKAHIDLSYIVLKDVKGEKVPEDILDWKELLGGEYKNLSKTKLIEYIQANDVLDIEYWSMTKKEIVSALEELLPKISEEE